MTGSPARMPALFLAHGNPMNAIADNDFTHALAALAAGLPRPEAILVVSAHWLTRGTLVLGAPNPRTLHDFGGFPRELYEIQYPAPGAPAYADRVSALLAPSAAVDTAWGLDHASWSVLRHMWPDASVPVFELSLDMTAPLETHFSLGRKLAPLRNEGVLVIGSGNLVHNLARASWEPGVLAYPWAIEFDEWIADVLTRGDDDALVHYESAGSSARLAVPTTEHYLPVLYSAAMRADGDRVTFPYTALDMASVSMRWVRFG